LIDFAYTDHPWSDYIFFNPELEAMVTHKPRYWAANKRSF